MNAALFTALFMVLIVIVYSFTIQQRDGFQPTLHIPESPVKQKNLVENSDNNYSPMAVASLGAAPGAIATYNALPYEDPSLEKAKYKRILNLQTTLQGFLANEAPHIEEMSDPSIQLPLNVARSDLEKLRNEVLVLKRNPGIDASMTQEDVDEIQANLVYLQKKWRLSVYNDDSVEGFDNWVDNYNKHYDSYSQKYAHGKYDDYTTANTCNDWQDNNWQDKEPSLYDKIKTYVFPDNNNYDNNPDSSVATQQDLTNLINKINATTTNLGSSGSTDPVIVARISVLNNIKFKINAILEGLQDGSRAPTDVPITKDSINNFLKAISNTDSPLPKIFGSNTFLSDLFPAYSSGDVDGAKIAQYLFTKYSDTLFKGISWNLNLTYQNETQQNLANAISSLNTSNINASPSSNNSSNTVSNDIKPFITSLLNNSITNPLPFVNTNNTSNTIFSQLNNQYFNSNSHSTKGQTFDWHERANFICDAIDKRGMKSADFGCLKPDAYVSDDFSWRGYAKMVCTRLGTSYDTGLPEVCGCPPLTWGGWKP